MKKITLANQIDKLKENWLIVVLVILVLLVGSGANLFNPFTTIVQSSKSFAGDGAVMEAAVRSFAPSPLGDFAPEIEERQITKTTIMASEIDRGEFNDAETKVLDIVKSSESILLNHNAGKRGKDKQSYSVGIFTIKVDTDRYDSVISQLKDIGETTSFNENLRDITQQFESLDIELESEKKRLQRFQQQLQETDEAEFKIQLTDRIFNQERRIKYLEDSLKNAGNRVAYSTIHLTLTEEQSSFSNIVFVKFGDLWRGLVNSTNLLLKFLFYILPWLLLLHIFKFLHRRFHK